MWIRRRSEANALVTLLACLLAAPPAWAAPQGEVSTPSDPMEMLRDRFRVGMEQYRAGRYGDAIVTWEQIYRELGSEKGYRLSFNLARAYDAAQDLTKAAEHYETYLAQVAKRRARGETLEAQVQKQEKDAEERLGQLAATRGRIRVVAGERPTAVQIDNGEPRLAGFVAYVAPGAHAVTFGTGTSATKRQVMVAEGEIVEVAPPEPEPVVVAPAPQRRPAPEVAPPPPTKDREPPFASTWLYVAGGVTLASAIVPVVAYGNALSSKSAYEASRDRAEQERLAADYEGERSLAYVSLGVTGALAGVTAGMTAAYFFWPEEARKTKASAWVTPQGVGVRGVF